MDISEDVESTRRGVQQMGSSRDREFRTWGVHEKRRWGAFEMGVQEIECLRDGECSRLEVREIGSSGYGELRDGGLTR